MKRLRHVLSILIVFLLALPSIAQKDITKATITEKGIIQIPLDKPLLKSYEVDISDLNFKSDAEALDYFRKYSAALYFMRPVLNESKAILYLDTKSKSEWTVANWNLYLEDSMKSNLLTQNNH